MRDDERPDRHQHPDDEEDRFDDALDDLFGPDDDDHEIQPQTSRQQPQPAGGNTPPPREYTPDPTHKHEDGEPVIESESDSSSQQPQLPGGSAPPPHEYVPDPTHQHDDETPSYGPEHESPPSSYDTSDAAPQPPTQHTSIPVSPSRAGRNWRRIACFGCLAAVGIPALCLGALIVIGLVAGPSETEPTRVGVFIDDEVTETAESEPDTAQQASTPGPTATNTVQSTDSTLTETGSGSNTSTNGFNSPLATIMENRPDGEIAINGEAGYGTLEKPIPLTTPAPLDDGWVLQLNAVTLDANQDIADANMFNDPPADDRQFVIANVSATNAGDAPMIFDASYRLRLANPDSGNIYTTFETEDRCGVVPDPNADEEIAPGDMTTGNVCWQVRIDDLDSLVLYSQDFSEHEVAVWFAVTDSG